MARYLLALLLLLGLSSPVRAQQFINAFQVSSPQDVRMTLLGYGVSTITVQATGGATLTGAFQVSDDGTNWIAITGLPQPSGAGVTSTTGDGYWLFPVAGHRFFQIHVTAVTGLEYFTLSGSPGGTTPPNGGIQPITPAAITPTNLDVTSLSGSAAATILSAGHAAHGGWVSSTAAYCISLTGTAGAVNNTPAGTSCFSANYIFALPAMSGAVSMYGLTAGSAYGQGTL